MIVVCHWLGKYILVMTSLNFFKNEQMYFYLNIIIIIFSSSSSSSSSSNILKYLNKQCCIAKYIYLNQYYSISF